MVGLRQAAETGGVWKMSPFPITLGLWVRGIDKIKLRVGRALGLYRWGKETS